MRGQDIWQRMDLGWMARKVLILALALSLLPWGAYHGAGGQVGRMVAGVATDAAQGTLTVEGQTAVAVAVASPAKDARLLPLPKRCKTGLPGGQGCASKALLDRPKDLPPPGAHRPGLRPAAAQHLPTETRTPPLPPPRAA